MLSHSDRQLIDPAGVSGIDPPVRRSSVEP